jgi:succinoglycan biosynthesis protein ExoA
MPKLRQVAPVAAALFLALTLLSPLSWLFAVPAALWLGLTLVGGIALGIRAGGGPALLAGSAAIIMHLSWGLGFLLEIIRSSLSNVDQRSATLAERR